MVLTNPYDRCILKVDIPLIGEGTLNVYKIRKYRNWTNEALWFPAENGGQVDNIQKKLSKQNNGQNRFHLKRAFDAFCHDKEADWLSIKQYLQKLKKYEKLLFYRGLLNKVNVADTKWFCGGINFIHLYGFWAIIRIHTDEFAAEFRLKFRVAKFWLYTNISWNTAKHFAAN